jgi:Putative peptidoglycan binding domain
MKKLICSVCISGLALATTALGDTKNQGNGGSIGVRGRGHAPAAASTSVAPATSRHTMSARPIERSISRAPVRQQTYVSTPRVRSNATVRNNTRARTNIASARVRTNTNATVRRNGANATVRNNANARVRNSVAVNRERSFARNRQVNVGSNFAVNRNRNRNVTVTNNWRGNQFQGRNYAVFRNYHRQWHDRGWWQHRYSRIIFVSGGWWYWNDGYWFPAWGYEPYAYYPYDGPIYGYSNLTPDQVVVNVQTQLANDGYYSGPIDGVLGPMTREAIAAFQADHGLAVTSTVDEPTMARLGLT